MVNLPSFQWRASNVHTLQRLVAVFSSISRKPRLINVCHAMRLLSRKMSLIWTRSWNKKKKAPPRNLSVRPSNFAFGCFTNCEQSLTVFHFTPQVQNSEKNGALGVLVFPEPNQALLDMNCNGSECNTQLNIPASMIPHSIGFNLSKGSGIYIRFQTTPSDTFVFGIDGEGKVEETGWFLYPSTLFMAYQAQWWVYFKLSFWSTVLLLFELLVDGSIYRIQGH